MEESKEGRSEKFMKDFGKKIDRFLEELDEASERAQSEFKGRYEELKVSAEKFRKDVKNKERWKEVEESLKKAGKELENAFSSAFRKRKDEK